MILHERPQTSALRLVQALDERDAVRIADRDRGDRQGGAVAELERYADDVAIGTVHRDLRRPEGRPAHLDGDEAHASALDAALALHEATLRIHREGRFLRAPPLPEVLRENPEPVAGFLRLAAVG